MSLWGPASLKPIEQTGSYSHEAESGFVSEKTQFLLLRSSTDWMMPNNTKGNFCYLKYTDGKR